MPDIKHQDYLVCIPWKGRTIQAVVRYIPAAYGKTHSYWRVETAEYATGEYVADMPQELRDALIDEATLRKGNLIG